MSGQRDESHWDEVDRLWRACRRDLAAAVLEFAGIQQGNASARLRKNWAALSEADLDAAAAIYHGVMEVSVLMARHGKPSSPADHKIRQMREVVGLATIARAANPSAHVETVGELLALGEQAVRGDIERDTRGT